MKNEIIKSSNNDLIEKENDINIENTFEYNQLSSKKNKKQKIDNNDIYITNNLLPNSFNEQETNEQTYSFKPIKQETPNFLTKDEKINVSDFILINNENNNTRKINKEQTVFTEILKTKIELNENIEEMQQKYLEEIDEKKRNKNIKNEMEKRCKKLRESIEINRKKLLENKKRIKSEKK